MEEEEKQLYQAQIAELNQRLKDTQAQLTAAQTANRRLLQDNQSLRYKMQQQWGADPALHRDPRIKQPTKE